MVDDTSDRPQEHHDRLEEAAAHARERTGHAAGHALGKGLGGVVLLAGLVILFGPFLLAPLTLAVQIWQASQPHPWQPWLWAVLVGVGVIGVQLLFAIQRQPVVRTLTVALFSFIFLVAAWLALTPDNAAVVGGYEQLEAVGIAPPPWWERVTRTGWIVIAAGTLLYAALYLFLLHRLDDRPWAKRLQLFPSSKKSRHPRTSGT